MSSDGSMRDRLIQEFAGDDFAMREIVGRLVDELEFLGKKMREVRELPFIETNGNGVQRQTSASKVYKECCSQQSNIARILLGMRKRSGEGEKDSPLRQYLRTLEND